MKELATIQLEKLMRKVLVSLLLIAVVGLSFASKGGGGDKKKSNSVILKKDFAPIRTTNGFTLKAGPTYTGSYFTGQEKTQNYISFHTVTTYEKGNTLFVMPYNYKVTTSPYLNMPGRTNLKMLDLKIRMHK